MTLSKIEINKFELLMRPIVRFDWWRGWDPVYENKTHSTDLLNAEAVRVVQVKDKSYLSE